MKSCNNRLAILSDEEIFALYALPNFNKEQHYEYFAFSENELSLIFSRNNRSAQIYCALQIGYFKAKQIFFKFPWQEIPEEDIHFLTKKYFGSKAISLQTITKHEHYAQVSQIAHLYGYRLWSKECAEELHLHVISTSRKDMNIGFISDELLKFIKKKKIVRPGYTTLQDIVSRALNDEYTRLEGIIAHSITEGAKGIIEKLLERDDIISYLAVLKQDAKNFGYKMMVTERQKLSTIKPLYIVAKELLPTLDISRQNLLHYAELVNYHTIFELRRLKPERLYLYVLCYIWQRYMQLTDNLVEAFRYHFKKFDNETKELAEDTFTKQSRNQQGKTPLIGKLLQLYVDKNISDEMTFGEIRRKYVFSLVPEEALHQTAEQMLHKPISEYSLKWRSVDKINHKFKKHLRATFMDLDFASSIPNNPLLTAANHLRQAFSNQKHIIHRNHLEDCANIIPKKLRQHLLFMDKDGTVTGLQSNRYEFWLYRQITRRLESGEIHLDDSISHRCFEHELIPLNDGEINQLDLPCLQRPIEEQLDELFKELKTEWELFDKMIKENKQKHIQYDTNTKTISFHRLKTSNVEKPEDPFYAQLPSVDIKDVMRFVQKRCNFLSALTPIQTRYTKTDADEDSLIAVILALSMNYGFVKMAKISDVPYHRLFDMYSKYFRKLTLLEVNKIISNAMANLSIFPYFSFDVTTLYGSVDAQKMETKQPTIKARHSKKHFGKGRGVGSFTLLINHNPAAGETIGSQEHESYFAFDIYYNNITDITPDAITGDMHSINKANFALLHWFKVDFRPRFTDLKTQLNHLYCGDELKNYQEYLVKPVGQIDRNLIIEEWNPKIKQILLTLANKETTQSKIIKKLCTYKQSHALKALSEFDKLVRSIYTLKYLRDPQLQQDVHRSQNRIESYHQLRAAISQVNGKKQLSGKTDVDIDMSNQCGRLVANAIIYFNSALLSLLLEKYQACNNKKAIEKLKKTSPAAWRNIHLTGQHPFYTNKHPIDLEEMLTHLEYLW